MCFQSYCAVKYTIPLMLEFESLNGEGIQFACGVYSSQERQAYENFLHNHRILNSWPKGCSQKYKLADSKMLNLYFERGNAVFCTSPIPLKGVWSIVNSLAGIKRLLNWKRAKNAMYLFSSPASLSLILRPSHSLKFNSSFKLQS